MAGSIWATFLPVRAALLELFCQGSIQFAATSERKEVFGARVPVSAGRDFQRGLRNANEPARGWQPAFGQLFLPTGAALLELFQAAL